MRGSGLRQKSLSVRALKAGLLAKSTTRFPELAESGEIFLRAARNKRVKAGSPYKTILEAVTWLHESDSVPVYVSAATFGQVHQLSERQAEKGSGLSLALMECDLQLELMKAVFPSDVMDPDVMDQRAQQEALIRQKEDAIANQQFEEAVAIRDHQIALMSSMNQSGESVELEFRHIASVLTKLGFDEPPVE